MGTLAAQCMCGVEDKYCLGLHIFDMFSHITHFFHYKVRFCFITVAFLTWDGDRAI